MQIKIKILKILPFWLIGLCAIFALQGAALFLSGQAAISPHAVAAVSQAAQPEVLGVDTSIRGQPLPEKLPVAKIKEPDVNTVSAKSFLVFDLATGQNLLEKNSAKKLNIASLTKLLTALVAYEKTDLNKSFVISQEDVLNVNPTLGLQPGDSVKALDIFNAMLIGSTNDAALALADFTNRETVENFVLLMNSKAESLGMLNSNFSNPMGFDSQYNYSTAEDLKKLIVETEKLAAFTGLGRRTGYEFTSDNGKTYSVEATNKLLREHPEIEAIKTGSTPIAGEAMATKFKLDGNDIVIILLGSKDREGDTLKLKEMVETSFK